MAEEDLIYGKNRHMFGGIEPSNMLGFKAISSYDVATSKARIKIIAELPNDTVINNQTLCTVSGAIIRKKAGSYPKDEFDGTLIADIKENTEIYDTDVVIGTTYYYAAFPYTSQGVYNRNKANRAMVLAQKYLYLYGYDLTISDTNPATRVTYPSDVDNASFEAAGMNFTSGKFNYGGWPSTPGEKFMPRPCMLRFDGTVAEYLNPDDYTKTVDGAASKVATTTFMGNAMMEWSKIYTHREVVNGVYKFRCSDIPLGDDWDCWCNYDKNNNVIDHFYTPIYFGSNISSVLRSISGQSNYVNNTAQSEINLAVANGDGWYTEVLADRLLIQDLLVLMAKNTELQNIYGTGRCSSSNSSAIGQGTMNTKGMFWGDKSQTNGVKVFGMENWWGNLWRRTAGWINANGTQKIKITAGTHDGSTANGYNLDGSGYITVADATPAGTSGGYISEMKTLPFGRIPFKASGSATTYEADGLWFNNGQVDYAIVGGDWDDALLVGPFCAYLGGTASGADANCGAALSCKPLAV